MKISPCLLLPACLPALLPAYPPVQPKDRPPVRHFRAIAPPPLGQCYYYCVRYLPVPHLLCAAAARRVTACLQPASCANFILHTTAPRSHYIAWLGLLQKKTNDGRSCTDSSEPFSFTHGLQMSSKAIAFTTLLLPNAEAFCLPYQLKFLDFFDLNLHWVSVVRAFTLLRLQL